MTPAVRRTVSKRFEVIGNARKVTFSVGGRACNLHRLNRELRIHKLEVVACQGGD